MKPRISLREALSDPNLLGGALAGDIWKAWRMLLIAAMGEELTDNERAIFKELTQREREPEQRVDELIIVAGRRGGKTRAMATLACYLAGLCDHTDALVPGECGVALLIAPNQRQARIALNYATAIFERSPILKQLVANRTADALELTNAIMLETRAASFRSLRGPTYVAVLADEAAFWRTEDTGSTNPDVEIINAVRPGLATTGGPLIIASSPYARRGVLWDEFKRHFGPDGDPCILVAKGASRQLNPSLSEKFVDRQLEQDHAHATAEYLAEFRTDIEGFVSIEVVESCVGDYREIAPEWQASYVAFVDPSGGSADSFTLAIAHRHARTKQIIVDAIRERRPPFSPEDVVNEFATLLKSYRVSKVVGDRYAGEFPRELFRKHNISYECAEQTKSDLFRDLLPLLNAGRIDLPHNDRLIAQLVGLERRTSRAGKDSISHAPNGHDDLINAAAGAAYLANDKTGFNTNLREWL